MCNLLDWICRKGISFLLIITLVLTVPALAGTSEVHAAADGAIVDMSKVTGDVHIENVGTDIYAKGPNGIQITSGPAADGIIITGRTTMHGVSITSTQPLVITLSDASIDFPDTSKSFSFIISNTTSTTITLKGTNTLKSGVGYAGLMQHGQSGLIEITGGKSDSLTAIGGANGGAGIGSMRGSSASNITISGGNITAIGRDGGAGIGGGSNGSASNIIISGGFVTATGYQDIGSGLQGPLSSNIKIIGGSIHAVNDKIESPTTSEGAAVYRVKVPAAYPDGTSLKGHKEISLSVSGSGLYNARTVSESSPEHSDIFPSVASAYIYLPEGNHQNISVGSFNNGYANVKASPGSKGNSVQWDIPMTVTFDGNGTDEVFPESKNVTYEGIYGDLPVATKAGYSHEGWFTTKDNSGEKVESNTTVTSITDHALYAHWTGKEYTVAFDVNGGNKLSSTTMKVTNGDTYGNLPSPAKKGYKFLGWYTSRTGGSKITSDTKVELADAQTLFARWQTNTYTISFKANAKNVKKLSPKTKKVMFDSKLGKLPSPKKTGYKFTGWYTKKKGGTKLTKNTIMKYDRNISLYAHWKKNGKIVNCYSVKIKSGPANKYKTKGYAKKNQKICILKKVKNGKYTWYKVKVGSKTGYIYKKYVRYI